eukprot:2919978-Heterocapsa_arctica.AAC.1
MLGICARLMTCTQAAFAEFDSYIAQLGFSLRTSTPEEEAAQLPAINSGLILADLPKYPNSNPDPVTIADNDLKVEARVPRWGNYDMACLRLVKFLPGERSKLASFRKGVRWALMSS